MFSASKFPPQWQTNPILNGKVKNQNFTTTKWNKSDSKNFNPWNPDKENKSSDLIDDKSDSVPENTDSLENNSKNNSSILIEESNIQDKSEQKISSVDDEEFSSSCEVVENKSNHDSDKQLENFSQKLKIAQQQGYVQGLKDGMSKALSDLETERNLDKDLVHSLIGQLEGHLKESFGKFEPLRRLSLHIAEQLVRGELSISGKSIDRLVKSCISELNTQEKFITLSANISDLERVKPFLIESESEISLHADNSLRSGSIRIRSNDAVIEDLIEKRLEALAVHLIDDPEAWIKTSSILAGSVVQSVETVTVELAKSKSIQSVDDVEDTSSKSTSFDDENQSV